MATTKLDQFRESVENITGLEGFGGDAKAVRHNLSLQGNASITKTNAVTASMPQYGGISQAEKDADEFWNYFIQVSNDYRDLLAAYRAEKARNEALRAERDAAINRAEEHATHLAHDESGNIIWSETQFALEHIDESQRQIQEGETYEQWQRRIRELIKLKAFDENGNIREEFRDDHTVQRIYEEEHISQLNNDIAASDATLAELKIRLIQQYQEDRKKSAEESAQLDFVLIAYSQGTLQFNTIKAMPPEQATEALQVFIEENPLLKNVEFDEKATLESNLQTVEETLKKEEAKIESLKARIETELEERRIELEDEGIHVEVQNESLNLTQDKSEATSSLASGINLGDDLSGTFNLSASGDAPDDMGMNDLLEGFDTDSETPNANKTQQNDDLAVKTNTPTLPTGNMG